MNVSHRLKFGFGIGLILLLLGSSLTASNHADEGEMVLLVTSGLSGRLTDGQGGTVASLLAELQHRAQSARNRGAEVLIFDAGRTITPYFESRFDRGATLLNLLDRAGTEAYLPDSFDRTQGRGTLHQLADNVSFPFLLAETHGDWDFPSWVTLSKEGIEVDLGSVSPGTGKMEAESSKLRIAVAQVEPNGPEDWAWKRWRTGDIPILFDPAFGDDVVVRRETESGASFLIGREIDWLSPWSVAEVTLHWFREEDRIVLNSAVLEVVRAGQTPVPELWQQAIEQSMKAMRKDLKRPASAQHPKNRRELIPFSLASLREATGAEIAFLPKENVRPVDPVYFEDPDYVLEAAARLYSVDQVPILVTLSGEELVKILEDQVGEAVRLGRAVEDVVVIEGVVFSVGEEDGEVKLSEVRVNGRKLYPQDPYRIVTTEGALTPRDEHPLLADRTPEEINLTGLDLRTDVVLPRLERVEEPLPDWRAQRLWRYGVRRFGFSLNEVRTDGTDAYQGVSDSRARADDTRVLRGEFDLFFDSLQIEKRWENRLRSRFGFLRTEEESKEVDDDLRFESSLVWNRKILWGAGFYTSFLVDSEWKVAENDAGEKQDRQLDLSLAGGLEWDWADASLRLGILGRHFAHQDNREKWGLVTDYHYLKKAGDRYPGVEISALVEGLFESDEDLYRADLEFRLLFPVYGRLVLAPTYNEYFYDSSAIEGAAHYRRFALALVYSLEGKKF